MGGKAPDSLLKIQTFLDDNNIDISAIGPYTKSKVKFPCVCNKCGYSWETRSTSLRRKLGCPKCNGRVLKSIGELQENIHLQGKNFTILSEPSYYKLEMQCEQCKYIWITTRDGALRNGCASCSRKLKGSLEKVQNKLDNTGRNIQVSGEYTSAFGKLSCLCTICNNTWMANPHNLERTGCPTCARTGFDPNKSGYLYYLRVVDSGNTYWKVGITNLGVKARFRPADRKKISILYCHLFENGLDAQLSERNILNLFKEYRAKSVNILQTGNTELFTKDVLQMDHLNWGPI